MKEYKVLSQNDQVFFGNFDPEHLEQVINSYAKKGWVVKSSFSAPIFTVFGPKRDEAIIILERDFD